MSPLKLEFPLAALSACLLLAAPSAAQLTVGALQGSVNDPSGAVVPGAELQLLNQDTGLVRTQTSGPDGAYIFNNVPAGRYTLRASYENFKTSEVRDVRIEINRNIIVDLILQPGSVTERIEVSAQIETIDTQSAVVRTNIDSKKLHDLPIASRNPLQFAELAPGVNVQTGALTGGSQLLGPGGITANVSGGRQQQNTFYLDGADNSSIRRNEGLQMPNVEAIEELQVVTSSNSAEYGKQPGGYFNVITKSGTNEFHGSAFVFFRDPSLNANEWQRNRRGLDRPAADQRQFGGTLGGPISRDRTFFFGSFQRFTDESVLTSQTIRHATPRMIAGDFSEFAGTLYNPDTNDPIPNNNLVAARLIDPVAGRIASELLPTVDRLGDRLVFEFESPPRNNEFLGKVDHNLTPDHRLQGSYFGTRGDTRVLPGGARAIPNFNSGSNDVEQNTFSVRHTWIINPRSILESQFSQARFRLDATSDSAGRDISDFGANWPLPIPGGRKFLPNLEVLDGFNSPIANGGLQKQNNSRFTSTLSTISGAHNIKVGIEIQRSSLSRFDDLGGTQFRFQGRFSNRGANPTATAPNALFAHSFADFMMGRVNDFSTSGVVDYRLPVWGYFGFIQDQWRVTPRLTIMPGLRYELWTSFKEENGRMSAFVENHQSDQLPSAPRHIAFQGDQGIRDGFIPQDRNNFGPRIGLAYDLFGGGRLVFRAGYGLYYAFPGGLIRTNATEEFPMRPNANGQEARLSDPWLTSTAPRFTAPPTPFPRDPLDFIREARFQPPFNRIAGFDPDFETPISHQWNVGFEGQITDGFTMNVGYVGNLGRNLLRSFPFNFARFVFIDGKPPSLDAANVRARQKFFDLSRFSVVNETAGRANYHSLQVSSNLRRGGVTLRLTYVYARDFGDGGGAFGIPDEDPTGFTSQTNNPVNPAAEWGRRSRINTFRAFYIYDLPFFRDQRSFKGRLLGGWQISGSTQIFSGDPIDVILGVDANFDAITSRPQDRPGLIGPIRFTSGSADEKMARFFDTSVFAMPTITADNLFGNLIRNGLFAPGRWTSDLAVLKNIRIGETMSLQVRGEAFNFLNHPNLDAPVTNMSAGDFGGILTKSGNRTMQIGLRFTF